MSVRSSQLFEHFLLGYVCLDVLHSGDLHRYDHDAAGRKLFGSLGKLPHAPPRRPLLHVEEAREGGLSFERTSPRCLCQQMPTTVVTHPNSPYQCPCGKDTAEQFMER